MADQRNGEPKASGGLEFDLATFGARMKALYKSWKEEKSSLWNSATAVSVATPPSSEDLRYLKSSALHIWLLGYEFPETVLLFLPDCLHVLCSQKKAAHLTAVQKSCKSVAGVDMKIHPKSKSEDGSSQMDEMLAQVRSLSNGESAKLGILPKEQPEGALMENWASRIESDGVETVDITNAFTELFAVKDESEITNIKKAAFLSASVLKAYVVPKLEDLIDEEKSLTHSELMELTEEVITTPSKIKVKLKSENCDICFPPVFQSGGSYDLKASAVSNDDPVVYDQMSIIVCAIGARYASYCSNIARTYLIDAAPEQERAYKTLLKAHEAAIAALKPGTKLSEAYLAVVSVVEKEAPELVPNLTRNCGTGIGIEYREVGLVLNAKNERICKAGMCFNVSLGFQGLKNTAAKEGKPQDYAILLADTVVVRPEKIDVATQICTKAFREVGYSLKDDEEEEEYVDNQNSAQVKGEIKAPTLRSENQDATKEELRKKHQAELAQKKIEETARRLASGGLGTGDAETVKRSTGDLVAYKSVDDIPTFRELMIQVDQKNEAVLLPIYGLMVPFHISTVKSVSSQQDGGHSYIRIIFNVPGAGYSSTDLPVQKCADSVYLKEISYRSIDVPHFNQVVQQIKTMGRLVKQRESARAERATLVTQEKLQMVKRPYKLPDLWIRPNFGGRGRKLTGTLELHANGFSYETPKMQAHEVVHVMFRNIRHAFFQPAENEMITLLHFHLHNPIMVGNKKTKDVQFYAEVMEVVQTVGGARKSAYDPDEIEEEQRERERRNKINSEFQLFVRKAQDLWENNFKELDLEFDIPFRELGFHGVPYKSSAFIVPTVNCIVELIETPFMVITLQDIEIVCLERVGLGQKSMDMAIVFKDFKRDVMRIDAIPSTSLDSIKEWLNSMSIKYYESRLNLNWKAILQNILDDPQSFLESGGWEFLNLEGTDTDTEGSEESEAYEPSDMEEGSDSEDEDDEDDESVVDSEDEDEDEEDEEGEDEEEGMTWEELEEKARKEDKEKRPDWDSDEERERRKPKVGRRPQDGRGAAGGSRAPPMRPGPGMAGRPAPRPGSGRGGPPPKPASGSRPGQPRPGFGGSRPGSAGSGGGSRSGSSQSAPNRKPLPPMKRQRV